MSGAPKPGPGKSRIPANSVFYNRVIPILLIGMAIATAVFILIAAGVLLGLVPYQ
jgi:hypothetical protein